MKKYIKKMLLLPALIAGLGLMPSGRVAAQTFTTLHSFTGGNDGANPKAGLILSGNTLYGTAQFGGSSGSGTVFAVNTDGTGFTNLYSFTTLSIYAGSINSDGGFPVGGLILSGNTLYGMAENGGSSGFGTMFMINTNGTGFANIHNFSGNDGAYPQAGLVLSGNILYGTMDQGGSSEYGTVFAVNTNGTGFTNLYNFTGDLDGGNPYGGLTLSGNMLYGTAENGGSPGDGTVFAINTNGTGFTKLHNFIGSPSDGNNPAAGLILAGNTLYGTATGGGSNRFFGTVFAVNTNGTSFTTLHSFALAVYNYSIGSYINSEGITPYGGLVLSGNTLYGTAETGGSSGNGTVFAVNIDGTGFTNLHTFTGGNDGANPYAGLILAGNTLYGTTQNGGANGNGTVFAVSLPVPPSIGIVTAGNKIVLSWPTNAASFTLQSITNLSTGIWSNIASGITIVGTNYMLTNTVNGNASFFRLKQ